MRSVVTLTTNALLGGLFTGSIIHTINHFTDFMKKHSPHQYKSHLDAKDALRSTIQSGAIRGSFEWGKRTFCASLVFAYGCHVIQIYYPICGYSTWWCWLIVCKICFVLAAQIDMEFPTGDSEQNRLAWTYRSGCCWRCCSRCITQWSEATGIEWNQTKRCQNPSTKCYYEEYIYRISIWCCISCYFRNSTNAESTAS